MRGGGRRGRQRTPLLCLGRLKVALAKKTGRPESEITGLEDGRRRRSSRLTEETGLEMEEEEETRGRKSRREEEVGWPRDLQLVGEQRWGHHPQGVSLLPTKTAPVPSLP